MKKAVFAGTFDPPTLGHLELIQKASILCDELIIAISSKPTKKFIFSNQEKTEMLKIIAPQAQIKIAPGLIADFAKEQSASFPIRGLRSFSDMDEEFQMANVNRRLGSLETIFLMTGSAHTHISSTLIREIAHFKGPLHHLVPEEIEAMIRKKFA